MTEYDIQKSFFEWVYHREVRDERYRLIHHTPNSSQFTIGHGVKMKRIGLRSGIPDVFVPIASKGFHGLYIEFKSEKGKLNKNQRDVIKQLRKQGYRVEIIRCPREAAEVVMHHMRYAEVDI